MEKETIAAFDFDGTITTRDTLFDFICYYKGTIRLIIGFIMMSPVLLLFKLGFLTNSKTKELLLSHFFKGEKVDVFSNKCQLYSERIKEIVRPKALTKIQEHKKQHHKLVIVSASIDQWIAPWAKENGFERVIGTRLEVVDGIITGKLLGKNCYGIEKVNRLSAIFPQRESYILYAYGDSSGDKELLAFADKSYYQEF